MITNITKPQFFPFMENNNMILIMFSPSKYTTFLVNTLVNNVKNIDLPILSSVHFQFSGHRDVP